MRLTLAAILFLIALVLSVIAALFLPGNPRIGHTVMALVAAGLMCMAAGVGQ